LNISSDRLGGLILLAFSLAYGFLALEITPSIATADLAFTARTMPLTLAVLAMFCSAWLVCYPGPNTERVAATFHWQRFFAVLVVMSGYGLVLRPLGFVGATFLFLFAGFVILGERRWLRLSVYAASISIVFWSILSLGLGVYIEAWPSFLAAG